MSETPSSPTKQTPLMAPKLNEAKRGFQRSVYLCLSINLYLDI